MQRIATLLGATALALTAAAPAPAGAQSPASLTVNSAADAASTTAGIDACVSGQNLCTLRNAVAAANQLDNGTGIVFAPALNGATIALTAGSLEVTAATSIIGPGSTALTIDGSAGTADGIIEDEAPSLTVSGLTLQNGSSSLGLTNNEGGGGIQQTAGALTVANVTFFSNDAGTGNDGGAIYAAGTSTTVTNSTFSGNTATSAFRSISGGAIFLDAGTLSVSGSAFFNNSAKDGGGAIVGDGGAVTVAGSTFTSNVVTSGDGGAIQSTSGTLAVTSSQFGGNSATGVSAISGGTVTISGSHVTSNTTSAGTAAISASTLDLSTTLVENNSGGQVGGVYAIAGYLTGVTLTGNISTEAAAQCTGTISVVGCAGGVALLGGSISGSTITGNVAQGATPNCYLLAQVTLLGGNTLGGDCTIQGPAPSATGTS